MAEVLIKYFHETTFEIGDVVDVREDGYYHDFNWPVNHSIVLRIPGVDPATVLQFIEEWYDSDDWSDLSNPPGLIKKRKFQIDGTKVPKPIENALIANREYTITESQFNSFIKNKIT